MSAVTFRVRASRSDTPTPPTGPTARSGPPIIAFASATRGAQPLSSTSDTRSTARCSPPSRWMRAPPPRRREACSPPDMAKTSHAFSLALVRYIRRGSGLEPSATLVRFATSATLSGTPPDTASIQAKVEWKHERDGDNSVLRPDITIERCDDATPWPSGAAKFRVTPSAGGVASAAQTFDNAFNAADLSVKETYDVSDLAFETEYSFAVELLDGSDASLNPAATYSIAASESPAMFLAAPRVVPRRIDEFEREHGAIPTLSLRRPSEEDSPWHGAESAKLEVFAWDAANSAITGNALGGTEVVYAIDATRASSPRFGLLPRASDAAYSTAFASAVSAGSTYAARVALYEDAAATDRLSEYVLSSPFTPPGPPSATGTITWEEYGATRTETVTGTDGRGGTTSRELSYRLVDATVAFRYESDAWSWDDPPIPSLVSLRSLRREGGDGLPIGEAELAEGASGFAASVSDDEAVAELKLRIYEPLAAGGDFQFVFDIYDDVGARILEGVEVSDSSYDPSRMLPSPSLAVERWDVQGTTPTLSLTPSARRTWSDYSAANRISVYGEDGSVLKTFSVTASTDFPSGREAYEFDYGTALTTAVDNDDRLSASLETVAGDGSVESVSRRGRARRASPPGLPSGSVTVSASRRPTFRFAYGSASLWPESAHGIRLAFSSGGGPSWVKNRRSPDTDADGVFIAESEFDSAEIEVSYPYPLGAGGGFNFTVTVVDADGTALRAVDPNRILAIVPAFSAAPTLTIDDWGLDGATPTFRVASAEAGWSADANAIRLDETSGALSSPILFPLSRGSGVLRATWRRSGARIDPDLTAGTSYTFTAREVEDDADVYGPSPRPLSLTSAATTGVAPGLPTASVSSWSGDRPTLRLVYGAASHWPPRVHEAAIVAREVEADDADATIRSFPGVTVEGIDVSSATSEILYPNRLRAGRAYRFEIELRDVDGRKRLNAVETPLSLAPLAASPSAPTIVRWSEDGVRPILRVTRSSPWPHGATTLRFSSGSETFDVAIPSDDPRTEVDESLTVTWRYPSDSAALSTTTPTSFSYAVLDADGETLSESSSSSSDTAPGLPTPSFVGEWRRWSEWPPIDVAYESSATWNSIAEGDVPADGSGVTMRVTATPLHGGGAPTVAVFLVTRDGATISRGGSPAGSPAPSLSPDGREYSFGVEILYNGEVIADLRGDPSARRIGFRLR